MSKYTKETAEALLKDLSDHFKEPVMPIGRYCDALRTWRRANEESGNPDRKYIVDATAIVFLAISKSNLLARLLYEGEQLRAEKCPVHEGKWSGCTWGDGKCPHCMSGSNVTGWIAKESR